jgi:hypothetical protein
MYYYSFIDALIARQYLRLPEKDRQRFDPFIVGFNPTDMNGKQHIENVLKTFPGVFVGIGEFSIHKELVSSKVAGHVASVKNPAVDEILDLAGDTGLLVILHCDINEMRAVGEEPAHAADLRELFARHPRTSIIHAHTGLGRVVGLQHVAAVHGCFGHDVLAFIYLARAAAISVFLLVPLSPTSVYVFSSVMGLLWLSTVPVTNATVAQIFGVAHLSMLSGFVFFSHQIGSFLGVWLGGYLYDKTGSYDVVWYIAIALGVFAAIVNLPVKESAIQRTTPPLRAVGA